jgi:uncharacterized protein (UPF0218 family)
MQLESGNEFILSPDVRKEIALNNGISCDPGYIRSHYAGKLVISVGDVTTEVLKKNGIQPFLEVVDLKTKRSESGRYKSLPGSQHIRNDPGTLNHDLFFLIERMIRSGGGRIEIEGEEDLAVLPIIFYSGQNTVVAYGIPDVGMACIEVNGMVKELVNNILSRMEVRCRN